MKIETIQEKDIPQILDIYNYYIVNTTFTLEEEKLQLDAFTKRVHSICKRYPYLVLKEGDEVLGYAYLSTFNERSAYSKTADLSIYLKKEQEHHGYGKILLDAIENEAKSKGIRTIISIVTEENKGSKAFHLKNGFLLEGELHHVAIKFQRDLGIYYFRKTF